MVKYMNMLSEVKCHKLEDDTLLNCMNIDIKFKRSRGVVPLLSHSDEI